MTTKSKQTSVRWFADLGNDDVASVGGTNASLDEMVCVPDGFVTGAVAYWQFLKANEMKEKIAEMIRQVIKTAHKHKHKHKRKRKVGICGHAPSDYPEFAAFLVDTGSGK